MESATDYFGRNGTFREEASPSYRQVFLARRGLMGLVLATAVGFAGFIVLSPDTSTFDVLFALLPALTLLVTSLWPRKRIHEVDASGVTVRQVGPGGEREARIPAHEVESVETVENDGPLGARGSNPLGAGVTNGMYWVTDCGVRIETTSDVYYVRSTRPGEFAAAVERLVDAEGEASPDRDGPPETRVVEAAGSREADASAGTGGDSRGGTGIPGDPAGRGRSRDATPEGAASERSEDEREFERSRN